MMTCASIYYQQIIEVSIIIYEESRNFINDKKYEPSTAQILIHRIDLKLVVPLLNKIPFFFFFNSFFFSLYRKTEPCFPIRRPSQTIEVGFTLIKLKITGIVRNTFLFNSISFIKKLLPDFQNFPNYLPSSQRLRQKHRRPPWLLHPPHRATSPRGRTLPCGETSNQVLGTRVNSNLLSHTPNTFGIRASLSQASHNHHANRAQDPDPVTRLALQTTQTRICSPGGHREQEHYTRNR